MAVQAATGEHKEKPGFGGRAEQGGTGGEGGEHKEKPGSHKDKPRSHKESNPQHKKKIPCPYMGKSRA